MHTGVRRSVGRSGMGHAARRNVVARPAPPSVAQSASAASGLAVAPASPARAAVGVATRGDELDAILARAVAERAHGESGTGRHPGAKLQRVLGLGKKQKKPARPTQVLPAPPRPKQGLPTPARPTQALPPSAAASPSIFIPGPVPQGLIDLGARQFDLGTEMDPFEARQFNLDFEAPAVAPPPPAMQPQAHATGAVADDGYAPDLVPDENGMLTVAGNAYLEWLVSSFAADKLYTGPRSWGAMYNLQQLAHAFNAGPPPRRPDRRLLANPKPAWMVRPKS